MLVLTYFSGEGEDCADVVGTVKSRLIMLRTLFLWSLVKFA